MRSSNQADAFCEEVAVVLGAGGNGRDQYFERIISEGHDKDTQYYSIVARNGVNQFEVVRFKTNHQLYQEKMVMRDGTPLISMALTSASMLDVLNSYRRLDKVNEVNWNAMINLYAPFIYRSRNYTDLNNYFVSKEVW